MSNDATEPDPFTDLKRQEMADFDQKARVLIDSANVDAILVSVKIAGIVGGLWFIAEKIIGN